MDSEPTFAIQAKAWAEKEENITELDSLKRLTASIDIKNERLVTKNILEQQSLIRDRLAKIPGFWPYALSALPAFEKFCCMKNDLDALGHLTDLELVVDWKDPRAFDLVFHFSENKYFSDKTLTRSYVLNDSSDAQHGLTASSVVKSSAGSKADPESISEAQFSFSHEADLDAIPAEIHWKSETDPAINLIKGEPRGEEDEDGDVGGQLGSFFHWFQDKSDLSWDDLGWDIREQVVPSCIDFFLGIAHEHGSDEEDWSSDDEDDEEEEDEIDLEEPENKRPAKKVKRCC